MPGVIEVVVSPSMRTNGHVNEARKCWIQNSKKKEILFHSHVIKLCNFTGCGVVDTENL